MRSLTSLTHSLTHSPHSLMKINQKKLLSIKATKKQRKGAEKTEKAKKAKKAKKHHAKPKDEMHLETKWFAILLRHSDDR